MRWRLRLKRMDTYAEIIKLRAQARRVGRKVARFVMSYDEYDSLLDSPAAAPYLRNSEHGELTLWEIPIQPEPGESLRAEFGGDT